MPRTLYTVRVHMADHEWSSQENFNIMTRLAREQLDKHRDKITPNSDVMVYVYEHAGWTLGYAFTTGKTDQIPVVVSSANDMAEFHGTARQWRSKWIDWSGIDYKSLGEIRRQDLFDRGELIPDGAGTLPKTIVISEKETPEEIQEKVKSFGELFKREVM